MVPQPHSLMHPLDEAVIKLIGMLLSSVHLKIPKPQNQPKNTSPPPPLAIENEAQSTLYLEHSTQTKVQLPFYLHIIINIQYWTKQEMPSKIGEGLAYPASCRAADRMQLNSDA